MSETTIFESASIATPTNIEENIRRGIEAMRHVISSHKLEPHAMYRKDIGWIGFEWGEEGEAPPKFKDHAEFRAWQKTGRRPFDKGGHGIAHIIAKRDWEGKYIEEFLGQKGKNFLKVLIEALARGELPSKKGNIGRTAKLLWQGIEIFLARREEKENHFWLITGYIIPAKGYRHIMQDKAGKILESADECASVTDHTTHLHMNGLHGFVQTWERQTPKEMLLPSPSHGKTNFDAIWFGHNLEWAFESAGDYGGGFCPNPSRMNNTFRNSDFEINKGWLYDL